MISVAMLTGDWQTSERTEKLLLLSTQMRVPSATSAMKCSPEVSPKP